MNMLIESTRAAQRELEYRRGLIIHLNNQLTHLRPLEQTRRNAQRASDMGSLTFGRNLHGGASSGTMSFAGSSGNTPGAGPSGTG